MLAVSLDNFRLVVVDVDIQRIVRLFTGHTNSITDMVGIFTHSSAVGRVMLGISTGISTLQMGGCGGISGCHHTSQAIVRLAGA